MPYRFATTPARSELMKKIKSKDTSPELILRKALWNQGLRYRLHSKLLPGNPDIILKKYKLAIFVDGEFWHGKNWVEKKAKIKSNREYWIPKIERNIQRDIKNNVALTNLGWTVIRFWQQDIIKRLADCIGVICQITSHPSSSNPVQRLVE